MYSQKHFAQIKQLFIKLYNRFPTQAEVDAIHKMDMEWFEASGESNFDDYFGEPGAYMQEESVMCLIEDAMEAMEAA